MLMCVATKEYTQCAHAPRQSRSHSHSVSSVSRMPAATEAQQQQQQQQQQQHSASSASVVHRATIVAPLSSSAPEAELSSRCVHAFPGPRDCRLLLPFLSGTATDSNWFAAAGHSLSALRFRKVPRFFRSRALRRSPAPRPVGILCPISDLSRSSKSLSAATTQQTSDHPTLSRSLFDVSTLATSAARRTGGEHCDVSPSLS